MGIDAERTASDRLLRSARCLIGEQVEQAVATVRKDPLYVCRDKPSNEPSAVYFEVDAIPNESTGVALVEGVLVIPATVRAA